VFRAGGCVIVIGFAVSQLTPKVPDELLTVLVLKNGFPFLVRDLRRFNPKKA